MEWKLQAIDVAIITGGLAVMFTGVLIERLVQRIKHKRWMQRSVLDTKDRFIQL